MHRTSELRVESNHADMCLQSKHESKRKQIVYESGLQQARMDTERIDKTPEALWHQVDERIKVRVLGMMPSESQKKCWAKRHKCLICQVETKPEELIVYTDGALQHEHGVHLTGAGIVTFCKGEAIFQE
jgi:hypothetical protein